MGPTIDELIGAGIIAAATFLVAVLSNGILEKWFAKAYHRLRAPLAQKQFTVLKTTDPSTYYCPVCGCQLVFRASYGRRPNSKFFRLWCEVCKTGVDKPIIKLKKGGKSQ